MPRYGIEIAKEYSELIKLKIHFLQILRMHRRENKTNKQRKRNLELVGKAIKHKEYTIKILRSRNRD